jgi:hypothetical protein
LQDIVDAVDGHQVVGLPGFAAALYLHPADEDLKLEVLRGQEKIAVVLPATQHKDEQYDLADLIDPRNVIDGLGVFVVGRIGSAGQVVASAHEARTTGCVAGRARW